MRYISRPSKDTFSGNNFKVSLYKIFKVSSDLMIEEINIKINMHQWYKCRISQIKSSHDLEIVYWSLTFGSMNIFTILILIQTYLLIFEFKQPCSQPYTSHVIFEICFFVIWLMIMKKFETIFVYKISTNL